MEPSVIWHLGPFALRGTTILWSWIAMAVVVLLFFLASRGASVEKPTKIQNVLEFIYDFISGFLHERFGEDDGKRSELFYLLIAIFMFILVANILGLVPFFHSATNDANTTLGLAFVVFVMIHIQGVRYRGGLGHLGSFFKPYPFLFIFALIEAFTSPLTLGLRLFGNIFAGDVLLQLGSGASPAIVSGAGHIITFVGSVLMQLLALGFNTFVDLIQAFVFFVLTLTYVAGSMGPAGEH